MIARWLRRRGWYRCEWLSARSRWSWWFKLHRRPKEGESTFDVASEGGCRGERTYEAVLRELVG